MFAAYRCGTKNEGSDILQFTEKTILPEFMSDSGSQGYNSSDGSGGNVSKKHRCDVTNALNTMRTALTKWNLENEERKEVVRNHKLARLEREMRMRQDLRNQ